MAQQSHKWILITYAEKVGKKYPNHKSVLGQKLSESLAKAQTIFPPEEFDIKVRNVYAGSNPDFSITRLEDGMVIGEIEKASVKRHGSSYRLLFAILSHKPWGKLNN